MPLLPTKIHMNLLIIWHAVPFVLISCGRCHKFGGLQQQECSLPQLWRCWEGRAPSSGSERDFAPWLFWCLGVEGNAGPSLAWSHFTPISAPSSMASSVSSLLSMGPLYRTLRLDIGLIQTVQKDLFIYRCLMILIKFPFPNKQRQWVLGGGCGYIFRGPTTPLIVWLAGFTLISSPATPYILTYLSPLSNTSVVHTALRLRTARNVVFFLVQLVTSYSSSAPNFQLLPPRALFQGKLVLFLRTCRALNAQTYQSPCHDASWCFYKSFVWLCFLHRRLQKFILCFFQHPRCSVMFLITFFISQINWNCLNKYKRKKI